MRLLDEMTSEKYEQPCPQIKIISNDQKILFYSKERLVRSSGWFRDLLETFDSDEIRLDFSGQAIGLFLNFLENEEVPPSIEDVILVLLMADYLHLHRLNCILNTESKVIKYFYTKIKGVRRTLVPFSRKRGVPHNIWSSLHYYLTHPDEVESHWEKNYKGTCRETLPLIWSQRRCGYSSDDYSSDSDTSSSD